MRPESVKPFGIVASTVQTDLSDGKRCARVGLANRNPTTEVTVTLQTDRPIQHTNLSASYRLASELVRMVRSGDLDIDPPYQRGSVWTDSQRIALIRSWLTGIPAGTVIISDRSNSGWPKANGDPYKTGAAIWACVDGRQRLTTADLWLRDELAVPSSWFDPEFIETAHDTDDGPYVRHSGLTRAGQRWMDLRATIQVAEAKTCASLADEATIYLLVNGGGTPQTDADLLNAEQVANNTGAIK